MKNIDAYRPLPFYFLTTADPAVYTQEAVNEAMQRCKDAGFGGIVLFNKPPHGFNCEEYLSDSWFELTERFIHACRERDMQLWINDGFNFPPGDAAGRIEAVAPHLKQLRLRPNAEGKLDIVEVPWGFPAFEEPESSRLFIKFVYEEYYRRFAPYFGNGITGFFSDADNRRINAHILKNLPEKYYPWSKDFARIFEERFGYRIEEHLAELFNESCEKTVLDYWLLAGELYQQWFANNYKWCQEHNVLYTFHSSDTGPLTFESCFRSSLFSEGLPLELLKHSDAPGTDHEILVLDGGTHYDKRLFTPKVTLGGGTENLPHPKFNDTRWDIRAKLAQSAAVLNGKERVMCEMFAATNHGVTLDSLRRIAAWQIMQGINFIVPHAVHHRLCGVVKHFAPPEFTLTTFAHGSRGFNDMLARCCQAAAAGELVYDYVVIDPSRQVLCGKDSTPFFELCDQLNRRPEGYIIAPAGYENKEKIVLDPLQGLPQLPEAAVTFDGGDIAFMRRKLENEEYLLCGNIWSDTTLAGKLIYQGKTYSLELYPGEIAIVGGPFESFRSPEKRCVQKTFDGSYPVVWGSRQMVAFDSRMEFSVTEKLSVTLLLPAGQEEFTLNGKALTAAEKTFVYHDPYVAYPLELASGKYILELKTPAAFHTPAFLAGEFDAALETAGDYARRIYCQYQLSIYEPEKAEFTFSPRRCTLETGCGWEKQGQIFYSGEALLDLGETDIPAEAQLKLPGFRDMAELVIDGSPAERKVLPPYVFDLPAGKHRLALRMWNTNGNCMERYAAPSGLQSAPVITVKYGE